jgi:regulator of sigma E protease
MLLTVVAFILILSVLVLVHELGHFFTARLSGVKVEELGLGYPPRVYGYKRGETIYSINAIPFGGFCKMLGEEDPNTPGSLASKSHAKRALILSAGSIMNILLPILLFTISFMVPHNMAVEDVRVTGVAENSPAQMVGIETGDIILEVNNREVHNRAELSLLLQRNLGKKTDLLIEPDISDGETRMVTLRPRWKPPEGEGASPRERERSESPLKVRELR